MIKITEENDKPLLEAWEQEAREVTVDTLAAFVRKLTTEYEHDYGTIVHAVHAAMRAAMSAVDKSPSGGITGFQASCIGWMLIGDLFTFRKGTPLRILDYSELLYPQNEYKFTAITPETWHAVRAMATKTLAETPTMEPRVRAHMESVAAGNVPFRLKVREQ